MQLLDQLLAAQQAAPAAGGSGGYTMQPSGNGVMIGVPEQGVMMPPPPMLNRVPLPMPAPRPAILDRAEEAARSQAAQPRQAPPRPPVPTPRPMAPSPDGQSMPAPDMPPAPTAQAAPAAAPAAPEGEELGFGTFLADLMAGLAASQGRPGIYGGAAGFTGAQQNRQARRNRKVAELTAAEEKRLKAEDRAYDRGREAAADSRAERALAIQEREDRRAARRLEREANENPNLKLTDIYDEQTGQSQKALVDIQTGEVVKTVGGSKAPSNGVTVRPDGTVQVGGSNMKLTEQQSKDLNYVQRGNAALGTIEQFESELADPVNRVAGQVPGIGNYAVSSEYQQANQAGREFLAAVLRKDTGAAITNQEFEIYSPMFLPQPGDGAEVLAQKRAARKRAMEAMRLGLGAASPMADQPVTQNPSGLPQGLDNDPLGIR